MVNVSWSSLPLKQERYLVITCRGSPDSLSEDHISDHGGRRRVPDELPHLFPRLYHFGGRRLLAFVEKRLRAIAAGFVDARVDLTGKQPGSVMGARIRSSYFGLRLPLVGRER